MIGSLEHISVESVAEIEIMPFVYCLSNNYLLHEKKKSVLKKKSTKKLFVYVCVFFFFFNINF